MPRKKETKPDPPSDGDAQRERPAPTHRDVTHQAAEERARAPQNRPDTVVGATERPERADA